MKNVLAWVKKNLIAVICAVIAVIVLPASIVFSSSWTSKVREDAKKHAASELEKVNANTVSYALPSVLPGVKETSFRTEPNAKVTEFLKEQKERLLKEAGAIGSKAEQINKRTPLIDGFFPKAASLDEQQSKGLEFADLVVGGAGRPSKYQQLFDKYRAGNPPAPEVVSVQLRDAKEREVDRLLSGTNRQITSQENTEITKRLVEQRLTEYRKRSAELSFYASPDVLTPPEDYLRSAPTQPPTPAQAFRWQWDLWVLGDVLEAFSRANGLDKGRLGVENAVVKRVEMISLNDTQANKLKGGSSSDASAGGGRDGGRDGGPGGPAGPGGGADPALAKALVQPNFGASITGRWNGAGNQVYSLRSVTVQMVVSSARLPELFDALASVNFMTLDGDLNITAVDPWKDLEEGYYYGEEPVVRVRCRIETVWLRSWLAPIMPEQCRKLLGVAYAEPKSEEKPGEKGERRGEGRGDGRGEGRGEPRTDGRGDRPAERPNEAGPPERRRGPE